MGAFPKSIGHDSPESLAGRPLLRMDALVPLPSGHWGSLATVETMYALAAKDARRATTQKTISDLLQGRTGKDAVSVLFLFARDGIIYQDDYPLGYERLQDFDRIMQSRAGDCDDKATWLLTALTTIGIPARLRLQSYDQQYWENGWDHVYVEYYDWDNWQWVALDPTADGHNKTPIARPGWRQRLPLSGLDIWV